MKLTKILLQTFMLILPFQHSLAESNYGYNESLVENVTTDLHIFEEQADDQFAPNRFKTPKHRCTYYSSGKSGTVRNFNYYACGRANAKKGAKEQCLRNTSTRYRCKYSACAIYGSGGKQCP